VHITHRSERGEKTATRRNTTIQNKQSTITTHYTHIHIQIQTTIVYNMRVHRRNGLCSDAGTSEQKAGTEGTEEREETAGKEIVEETGDLDAKGRHLKRQSLEPVQKHVWFQSLPMTQNKKQRKTVLRSNSLKFACSKA